MFLHAKSGEHWEIKMSEQYLVHGHIPMINASSRAASALIAPSMRLRLIPKESCNQPNPKAKAIGIAHEGSTHEAVNSATKQPFCVLILSSDATHSSWSALGS
ncbi:uncharacterized protein VTP21DRAFT_746 [Calcarisporiella thermophila]|uniref:uncharacterized protein n=1 Tax=Calcarisporiella thermophila TaxID=911321 RepID=UPI003742851F